MNLDVCVGLEYPVRHAKPEFSLDIDRISYRKYRSIENVLRSVVNETREEAKMVRFLVRGSWAERVDWQPVRFANALTVTADTDRRSRVKREPDCTECGVRSTSQVGRKLTVTSIGSVSRGPRWSKGSKLSLNTAEHQVGGRTAMDNSPRFSTPSGRVQMAHQEVGRLPSTCVAEYHSTVHYCITN